MRWENALIEKMYSALKQIEKEFENILKIKKKNV
jgi:hypothetical protein